MDAAGEGLGTRDLLLENNALLKALTAVSDTDTVRAKEVWQLMGLEIGSPVTTTQSSADVGTIHQNITGDGVNTSTITRTT